MLLGGSCQLALGLAEAMILADLHPILTFRSEGGRERIDAHLESYGGQYTTLYVNLTHIEQALTDQQLAPGVHYLVDFAQEDLEGLVASVDRENALPFFEANIAMRSVLIRRMARHMMALGGGRLVYVSSVAAARPHPGQGFYAAAKCAAEALYRNVGLELAGRGITTATLRPGYVDAGRGRGYLKKSAERALAKVPLGRALTIGEVVDALLFLLSDSAVGFNATVLTMDGGLSAGK